MVIESPSRVAVYPLPRHVIESVRPIFECAQLELFEFMTLRHYMRKLSKLFSLDFPLLNVSPLVLQIKSTAEKYCIPLRIEGYIVPQ